MKLYDVPELGCKIYLRDNLDLFGFIQNAVYEPDETQVVKQYVKPGYCCLDIGANIGYYTVLMAELGAYVDAFEPESTNYLVLQENVSKYDRVNTYNYAVSNVKQKLDLYLARVGQENINHGMHRMYKSKWCSDKPVKLNTMTIDSMKKEHVDFVKMDVEGWEFKVLLGMKKTIKRFRPTMMIEFHPPTLQEAGEIPEHVYSWLSSYYDIYLIPDLENKIISFDNLEQNTTNISGRNILCCATK